MPTDTIPSSFADYQSMTKAELYEIAQERDLDGRSNMTKDELAEALALGDHRVDAVDLVKRQHEQIRSLFEAFEECSDRPSKKKDEIVGELITILVKHARMEELILYPAVRREIPDIAEELDEGIEEHHLADLALAELVDMDSTDERFDMKVHVMIEAMEHHLEEEEEDLLPKIVDGIDARRRLEIGAAMEEAWKAAPTRPHPSAPQTPPGNIVASLVSTVYDSIRNLFTLLRRR